MSTRPRMMMMTTAALFAGVVVVASAGIANAGEADTEACLLAAEQGEHQKKSGQLVSAKTKLLVCAADGCPAPVRAMCRGYLDEVESSIPTLEVTVRDREGRPLIGDLKITIDNEEKTPGPDGTFAVDPGARVVRVEYAGVIEEMLVKVATGQKRTPVVVIFGSSPAPPPAPVTEPRASSSFAPVERAPRPTNPVPYVFGGVGVLALGGATVFGIRWISDSDCKPRCSDDEVDRVRTDALVTDIFLGVGIVSLGLATLLFLSGSGSTPNVARR